MRGSASRGIYCINTLCPKLSAKHRGQKSYGGKSPTGEKVLWDKSPRGQKSSGVNVRGGGSPAGKCPVGQSLRTNRTIYPC